MPKSMLSLLLLLLLLPVSTLADDPVPTQPSIVTTSGRQIVLQRRNPDGTLAPAAPYVIRGVNWSPASTNTPNSVSSRRTEFGKWYAQDIPLFVAMNVNTVRFFIDPGLPGDPGLTVAGLTILDELYRNGIMAIMTVDDGNDTTSRIQPVVNHYENHPAVLMWSVGSEWNINRFFNKYASADAAAAAAESSAQAVKASDTQHPVASSYGTIVNKPNAWETYVTQTCPTFDVWSFNEYRGPGFSRFFDQWAFVSTKPIFLGEYGIDAYDSVAQQENQATHALWGGWLADDIARNLSVGSGGTIFEWNDEWWKSGGVFTQDTGGWSPPGFPDMAASEDWWGVVKIGRQPRQLHGVLATRFAPGYQPPPLTKAATYRAESLSGITARFWEDGALMYEGLGASLDGGRGFNIAAIDPSTGHLRDPIQRFDTWGTRNSGTDMNAMIAYLDALPNGTIILIAVGDEAGLNQFDSCTFLPHSWVTTARQRLQALGSTQIDSYCYRDQWAMVTIKGQGVALAEQRSQAGNASAEARIHAPWTDDPLVQQVTAVKAVHVTELRSRIDLIRAVKGLGAFVWSSGAAAASPILAQHIVEMRTALGQAYTAAALSPPGYTDPSLAAGFTIQKAHVAELRAAVIAIE